MGILKDKDNLREKKKKKLIVSPLSPLFPITNGISYIGNTFIKWVDARPSLRRWVLYGLMAWILFLCAQFIFLLTVDIEDGRVIKLEDDNVKHYQKERRFNDRVKKIERILHIKGVK